MLLSPSQENRVFSGEVNIELPGPKTAISASATRVITMQLSRISGKASLNPV